VIGIKVFGKVFTDPNDVRLFESLTPEGYREYVYVREGNMTTEDEIKALEERLEELKAQANVERIERSKLVQPMYKFVLEPIEKPHAWDRLYDETCMLYSLYGELLNADELRDVGKVVPSSGGMTYLWNGATDRFVCATGGGQMFVKDTETWNELSKFIKVHRDGGDVTEIVDRERLRRQ